MGGLLLLLQIKVALDAEQYFSKSKK